MKPRLPSPGGRAKISRRCQPPEAAAKNGFAPAEAVETRDLPRPRRSTAAFSLVEIMLALGILAVMGLGLVGLLGAGLNVTGEALAETDTIMLVENVQARLQLDPAWPGKQLERWFDEAGGEVRAESSAAFRISFKAVDGATGFKSDYLDTFRVVIERLPQKSALGTWTLQRARLAQGTPERATP